HAAFAGRGEVVHRQADLLEVVAALRASGRLADFLHSGYQEPDEDGNDGDHHQQFDEGETAPASDFPDHAWTPWTMDIKTKERAASPRQTERPVTSATSAICSERMAFSNRSWQHHLLPGGSAINESFFRIVARVAGAIRYTRGADSSASIAAMRHG